MEYRPCIDIHNGKVKQIVGASLSDEGETADENFVSERDADFFAKFYRDEGLMGGHIVMLNKKDSPYYEATKTQAMKALEVFPGGMQVGGGITPENARDFIDAGASHVIVTSYIFTDGELDMDKLKKMTEAVGREHMVLDLTARRRHLHYYVVTDRWQTFTGQQITPELFSRLEPFCDEYLVHAADVEGLAAGVDDEVLSVLSQYEGKNAVTYAGGISSYEDIEKIRDIGRGRINITIGSALDLFGGELNYETVRRMCF